MRKSMFILMILSITLIYNCVIFSSTKDTTGGMDNRDLWQQKIAAGGNYHRVEIGSFPGTGGDIIPGILLLPENREKPVPCIIALHGLTGSKYDWLEFNGYTKGGDLTQKLLDRGFAVLAFDAALHGERFLEIEPEYWHESEEWRDTQMGYVYTDFIEYYQSVVDDTKAALNYLESRNEIDTSRLGIMGYSLGGYLAFAAANADKRIRTCAAFALIINPDSLQISAPQSNISNLADVPVFIAEGEHDPAYNKDGVEWFYNSLPGEHKKLVVYDGGHSLPAEYTDDFVNWIMDY